MSRLLMSLLGGAPANGATNSHSSTATRDFLSFLNDLEGANGAYAGPMTNAPAMASPSSAAGALRLDRPGAIETGPNAAAPSIPQNFHLLSSALPRASIPFGVTAMEPSPSVSAILPNGVTEWVPQPRRPYTPEELEAWEKAKKPTIPVRMRKEILGEEGPLQLEPTIDRPRTQGEIARREREGFPVSIRIKNDVAKLTAALAKSKPESSSWLRESALGNAIFGLSDRQKWDEAVLIGDALYYRPGTDEQEVLFYQGPGSDSGFLKDSATRVMKGGLGLVADNLQGAGRLSEILGPNEGGFLAQKLAELNYMNSVRGYDTIRNPTPLHRIHPGIIESWRKEYRTLHGSKKDRLKQSILYAAGDDLHELNKEHTPNRKNDHKLTARAADSLYQKVPGSGILSGGQRAVREAEEAGLDESMQDAAFNFHTGKGLIEEFVPGKMNEALKKGGGQLLEKAMKNKWISEYRIPESIARSPLAMLTLEKVAPRSRDFAEGAFNGMKDQVIDNYIDSEITKVAPDRKLTDGLSEAAIDGGIDGATAGEFERAVLRERERMEKQQSRTLVTRGEDGDREWSMDPDPEVGDIERYERVRNEARKSGAGPKHLAEIDRHIEQLRLRDEIDHYNKTMTGWKKVKVKNKKGDVGDRYERGVQTRDRYGDEKVWTIQSEQPLSDLESLEGIRKGMAGSPLPVEDHAAEIDRRIQLQRPPADSAELSKKRPKYSQRLAQRDSMAARNEFKPSILRPEFVEQVGEDLKRHEDTYDYIKSMGRLGGRDYKRFNKERIKELKGTQDLQNQMLAAEERKAMRYLRKAGGDPELAIRFLDAELEFGPGIKLPTIPMKDDSGGNP